MRLKRNLRIAVLLGGISSERDISMQSGRGVARALRECGFQVSEIMVDDRKLKGVSPDNFDVVFIALHGLWGEDGGVQRLLQRRGLVFTGSGARASMLAMDKVKSKKMFERAGLNVPRYTVLAPSAGIADIRRAAARIGYPLVVKPVSEGSSIGVTIISEEKNADTIIKKKVRRFGRSLVEEWIKGREMTVGILRGKALPVVEIRPKSGFFDFEAKYDGSTDEIPNPELEARCERRIKAAAVKAHNALGCAGFSRVDMMLSEENVPFVLEVNTIPGFTETSLLPLAAKAAGITFENLCERIVKSALNGK
jgi:D-alanine-D-alanine ligase